MSKLVTMDMVKALLGNSVVQLYKPQSHGSMPHPKHVNGKKAWKKRGKTPSK